MGAILITLLVSVTADVIGYYICKWLDRDKTSTQSAKTEQLTVASKKTPEVPTLWGFRFCRMDLITLLGWTYRNPEILLCQGFFQSYAMYPNRLLMA